MLPRSGIIYRYEKAGYTIPEVPAVTISPIPDVMAALPVVTMNHQPRTNNSLRTRLGILLSVVALGGLTGPLYPTLRIEGYYAVKQGKAKLITALESTYVRLSASTPVPSEAPNQLSTVPSTEAVNAQPVTMNHEPSTLMLKPLLSPDGGPITPINTEFSIIVPKVGINAPVVAAVDPANRVEYDEVLKKNVAHAETSLFPGQNGTVYLFSHSTNYDWFVRDINAIFYLLKNLEKDDYIVVFYKGKQYTYKMTEKRVVSPTETSYLMPERGREQLILETCWPPGSTTERLLIFADLVADNGQRI